jgi:hypothetical protein
MDKLTIDSNNLWEVMDVQIKGGLMVNYKITTLKEHLKMERPDKEKFLDRLNKLNDEAFTFRHQDDVYGAKQDHKEDIF